jgi:capsular exopolysaccharide synthesis family protein
MSRIQNILEKAERDGSIRRMRGADPVGAATTLAVVDSADAGAPVTFAEPLGARAATAVPAAAPIRVLSGALLDPRLVTALASSGIAAEQYRALRTRILHADNGSAVNVLLVTSPGRGDGKTTTAGNLALTMAQDYQRRICLVDGDMRHPQLHRLFGLPEGPGLAEVLTGQATLDEALMTIEEHQITVLSAGQVPGRPAELLGTTAMRRMLETLRSRFDRVVIDAPATTPLADVGILTPLVDSVLLVVRSGVTSKPAIHDAVATIGGSKLLGVVLNDAA